MKKRFLSTLLLSSLFLFACTSEKKENVKEAEVTDEQEVTDSEGSDETNTYTIDTSKSTVVWTGYKFDKYSHTGNVDIKKGILVVEGNELKSGSFVIDMSSIREKGKGTFDDMSKRKKLEGHLKNEDFFEVNTYPTAKFEITGIKEIEDSANTHELSGNLTIKETTKNVTFPAKVEITGEKIRGYAELRIDRADWNVRYGSNTFFDNLGDKAISNEIDFIIDIVAKK